MQRWMAGVALAVSMVAGAHAQADMPLPQDDTQLKRLMVDFHMADLLRIGMLREAVAPTGTPIDDAISDLRGMSTEQILAVVTPSLRGSIDEGDARKICDFLETASGKAMMQWIIQKESHPTEPEPPRPALNKKELDAFAKSGGSAAMHNFNTFLHTRAFQKKMMYALLHYVTRPEAA